VLIDECHCKPAWLAHELMDLLHVHEQHGPAWCTTMIHLWSDEFGVDRFHALALAQQHDVTVGDADRLKIRLTTGQCWPIVSRK
jgi:hypothetical protein